MRFALMGLLALGVVGGYGSAIARAAHGGGGCHSRGGWHDARWQDSRFGSRFDEARSDVKQAAPAPAPQTVVVQQPAPAAAPAPQIFVIMPGAQAAPSQPQTIVVPTVAVPAVAASPAQPQ